MATYGLQLPDFSWIVDADPPTTMDRLRAVAEAADEAGFSSLWVMDHLLQLPPLGGPAASILEGYVTLGALAAVTKHVELGTLVTGVTYRNPAHCSPSRSPHSMRCRAVVSSSGSVPRGTTSSTRPTAGTSHR